MRRLLQLLIVVVLFAGVYVADVRAQRGRGGPGRNDPAFVKDRSLFSFLLAHRMEIERRVVQMKDGVQTTTESANPQVAAKIQERVAERMCLRLDKGRPIHLRDPLFAEIFRHRDKIHVKVENTKKGVKVTETSEDPYVARLIQSHAAVVSAFLKNGPMEVRKNHPLPKKP